MANSFIIQHLNKQLSLCQEQINLLKTKNNTDKSQLSRWYIEKQRYIPKLHELNKWISATEKRVKDRNVQLESLESELKANQFLLQRENDEQTKKEKLSIEMTELTKTTEKVDTVTATSQSLNNTENISTTPIRINDTQRPHIVDKYPVGTIIHVRNKSTNATAQSEVSQNFSTSQNVSLQTTKHIFDASEQANKEIPSIEMTDLTKTTEKVDNVTATSQSLKSTVSKTNNSRNESVRPNSSTPNEKQNCQTSQNNSENISTTPIRINDTQRAPIVDKYPVGTIIHVRNKSTNATAQSEVSQNFSTSQNNKRLFDFKLKRLVTNARSDNQTNNGDFRDKTITTFSISDCFMPSSYGFDSQISEQNTTYSSSGYDSSISTASKIMVPDSDDDE